MSYNGDTFLKWQMPDLTRLLVHQLFPVPDLAGGQLGERSVDGHSTPLPRGLGLHHEPTSHAYYAMTRCAV